MRHRPEQGTLWRMTLWAVGLLVSMMTGTLSAYVVLTVVYIGSRTYAQIRRTKARHAYALRPADTPSLTPGDEATEISAVLPETE